MLDRGEELAQLGGVVVTGRPRLAAARTGRRDVEVLPRPLVAAYPCAAGGAERARRPEAQPADDVGDPGAQPVQGKVAGVLGVALDRDQDAGLGRAVAVEVRMRPGRLARSVRRVAAHERDAAAQVDPARLEPRAAQRRDRDDAGGAVVERSLELVVDAVEALLGEVERGGVLVQALEHRAQRRLGLGLGLPVRTEPGRGAGAELARGGLERGELRELRPVRADVLGGQRPVAVQDRAGTRLLRNVEAELVSRLDGLHEGGGGFQREVAKGRVEGGVAHGGEFATAAIGFLPQEV